MYEGLDSNVEPFTPEVLENNEGKGEAMLDVHPPTAAIHGWKDFFVHIATITIGLLIAIGLEQTSNTYIISNNCGRCDTNSLRNWTKTAGSRPPMTPNLSELELSSTRTWKSSEPARTLTLRQWVV